MGVRLSKIGESLFKKTFSIGGKSEIGGRGVKNDPEKLDIIYGWPLIQFQVYIYMAFNSCVLSPRSLDKEKSNKPLLKAQGGTFSVPHLQCQKFLKMDFSNWRLQLSLGNKFFHHKTTKVWLLLGKILILHTKYGQWHNVNYGIS